MENSIDPNVEDSTKSVKPSMKLDYNSLTKNGRSHQVRGV